MSNSRNLVGKDLLNLFKMIDKYGIVDETKTMIVNVAANFETIDSEKIMTSENDNIFDKLNEKLEKKELDKKLNIIKKFIHI